MIAVQIFYTIRILKIKALLIIPAGAADGPGTINSPSYPNLILQLSIADRNTDAMPSADLLTGLHT